MRILVFHGYMLRGTGSNIYNVNLARALAKLGHEVHLLCQDREIKIEGVEIHNPDIGGLLPVYVKDPYEGFEVKAFPELTEEELDRYIEANVAAVRDVAERAGGIDLALANHLVMGPAILARADVAPFAAKIHGSALEYTVKPHPRFLPYAREGMEAAQGVLVGSRHTAESLWAALPEVGGSPKEKTRLGPPGVDTEAFRPRESGSGSAGSRSRGVPAGPDPDSRRRVVFVGKLIVSKGVDLLLGCVAAGQGRAPGGAAGNRRVRRVRSRAAATCWLRWSGGTSTTRGRLRWPAGASRAGRRSRCRSSRPSSLIRPPATSRRPKAAAGSVEFIGRLEHDEVAELLPGAEALVMPSTFPEAFGMVAAEAAACGVLPVSAGHSGMLEVSRQLMEALPGEVGRLTSFPVEAGAVEAIAERLNGWLALPEPEREEAREALVETARRLWSWEGVARGVLAAAAGQEPESFPPSLQ